MKNNQNNKTFLQCTKLIIDANIELFGKSSFEKDNLVKSELEIAIFSCANLLFMKLTKTKSNDNEEFKNNLIYVLSWFFSQQAYFLPKDYYEKRFSEYQADIEQCIPDNLVLPLYSYYSVLKSPLRQFELEKVNDFDTMELYKFKLFMFNLSDMNAKAAEFLLNL
jgi:hypothetical protein